MSLTASTLAFASRQLVIYLGFFIFILGIIGGPLVLLVFLSLHTFRQNSCAFYLTIMSIVNTLHLFTGLLTFIMINGFAINWTELSPFYCKFRSFYVQLSNYMSFTCMSLATIDQFLATCSHPRWHRCNNIRFARWMVIGTFIVWISHGIPFLLYFDHIHLPTTGRMICGITNSVFQKYVTYFHILVLGTFVPIIIMTVFGVLAYRNVQQIAYRNVQQIAYRTVPMVRRELDKQLTLMVLVQVLCDIVFVTPLAAQILRGFFLATPTDLYNQMVLRLVTNLEFLWFYFRYAVSLIFPSFVNTN